jgi:hypothetical protein
MSTSINVDNYKGYPTEVFINQKGSLSKLSCVQADKFHPVPRRWPKKFPGSPDSETMLEVAQKFVLALELESAMPDG